MFNQRESNNSQHDVKMGSAESSQSSELGAIAGLNNQTSFHRQSPNVARLVRSENSSKMEYEFPISDTPTNSSSHHRRHRHRQQQQHGTGANNHCVSHGNNNRLDQFPSSTSNSATSQHTKTRSGHISYNRENRTHSKFQTHQTSNIWLSLTSCFGCRTRASDNSPMNSLRDKVHAIRIVRASNDLTPAVFDSHYNIITLEQLRECDNNTSGNMNSLPNDLSDSSSAQNPNSNSSTQNGNGSVAAAASSKKDTNHRIKKKKKKRGINAKYGSRSIGSDDDDDDDDDDVDGFRRT